MFRTRPDARPATVEVIVEGAPVLVPEGASAAAAVLIAGYAAIRETTVTGAPRGPFCLMGVCFDCMVTIDGRPNQQACVLAVAPGMRVETGGGLRAAGAGAEEPR